MRGVVVKYNSSRGFGFIRQDGSDQDLFVHIKSVTNAKSLNIGDEVSFEVESTDKGLAAISVVVGTDEKPLGKSTDKSSNNTPLIIGGVIIAVIVIGLIISKMS